MNVRLPSLRPMPMLSLFSFIMFAVFVLLAPHGVTAWANTPYSTEFHASLIDGEPITDAVGDVTGHAIYAEERAIVSPFPKFAVYRTNVGRVSLVPAATAPLPSGTTPSPAATSSSPYSNSYLHWYTLAIPPGASAPTGTHTIAASSSSGSSSSGGDYFQISDWVFPLKGTYNILFNVTLHSGERFRFNRTVHVNPQPTVVKLVSVLPTAVNGSAFDPSLTAQVQDWTNTEIRTNRPVIQLVVVSAASTPGGGKVVGAGIPVRTDRSNGIARFVGVYATLPGHYALRFSATLSDNSVLLSPVFSVAVAKALPTQIVQLTAASAVARYIFTSTPRYAIMDVNGIVLDTRVNITLSLGFNTPQVSYIGLDTMAILGGVTSLKQKTSYILEFPDLVINLPGIYALVATVYVDGVALLWHTQRMYIPAPPTYELSEAVKVNTPTVITLHGPRPSSSVVNVKLSTDVTCVNDASGVVRLVAEPSSGGVQSRNLTITPYKSSAAMHMCMQLPNAQEDYLPLIGYYVPSFNELFPLVYAFPVEVYSSCPEVSSMRAKQYQAAGWVEAEAGRSYGCKLKPPVDGTIAPCGCGSFYRCESYTHPKFTPPNLDIGRCVCCSPAISAIAGTALCGFLTAFLYVVYRFV